MTKVWTMLLKLNAFLMKTHNHEINGGGGGGGGVTLYKFPYSCKLVNSMFLFNKILINLRKYVLFDFSQVCNLVVTTVLLVLLIPIQ